MTVTFVGDTYYERSGLPHIYFMNPHLRSTQVLNSSARESSVDVLRGIAILSVVLFHYPNTFPLGYLGVDLFFVISGLLVGGMLVNLVESGRVVHYWRFVLRRGGKIWPSYYLFIILGTMLARLMYTETHPDQIIPLWDMNRYLFFYQNYTGVPFHWSFDHVWSICVEEHFYLGIPLVFILVQRFFRSNSKILFAVLFFAVVAGFVFKILMLKYSHGQDTYSATHNRIDALAYGILLSMVIRSNGENLRRSGVADYMLWFGLLFFGFLVYLDLYSGSYFYDKVVFHSLTPLSFGFIILGVFHKKVPDIFYPLRVMAYYSYNWYLWHPLLVFFISDHFERSWVGLPIYLVTTFAIAFLATVLIEEPFLAIRNKYLKLRPSTTPSGSAE